MYACRTMPCRKSVGVHIFVKASFIVHWRWGFPQFIIQIHSNRWATNTHRFGVVSNVVVVVVVVAFFVPHHSICYCWRFDYNYEFFVGIVVIANEFVSTVRTDVYIMLYGCRFCCRFWWWKCYEKEIHIWTKIKGKESNIYEYAHIGKFIVYHARINDSHWNCTVYTLYCLQCTPVHITFGY